uniref:Uncharacterized protein n=1 Tax=Myoviridae sp. ctplG2 TaxID=2826700 RepID=A0A8S5LVU1_9CAUD|nr:MAG TPA: hypothetical protein [Myoviridae sp. ctplG2]DAO68395.1 MAG TPA: hypothetical protein [Caudoviricetes sp.]
MFSACSSRNIVETQKKVNRIINKMSVFLIIIFLYFTV